MAVRKSTQTKQRRASIEHLLNLGVASPYMHPPVQIEGDDGMAAAQKLAALRKQLELVRH